MHTLFVTRTSVVACVSCSTKVADVLRILMYFSVSAAPASFSSFHRLNACSSRASNSRFCSTWMSKYILVSFSRSPAVVSAACQGEKGEKR